MSDLTLNDLLSNFMFIRPEALWLLILVIPVAVLSWKTLKNQGQWQKSIDPHLLKFLLLQGESSRSWWPLIILLLTLITAILAFAGPSFEKKSVPVYRTGDARVIILDLSLSMDAVDIKPSRLTRAKHKLTDILTASKEGETALIVYAGDAFIISPLTSDANTIKTMVPVLNTGIMPVLGSEPYKAFEKAKQLLINSGKQTGQIIWLTDGMSDVDAELISDTLNDTQYTLSILTIATDQGAPIPLGNDKGFLKDSAGDIVMPTLRMKPFQDLAQSQPTVITGITADNRDIEKLMTESHQQLDKSQESSSEKVSDQLDQGYWLLFPLLPLLLLMFRKNGRLPGISLMLCVMVMHPNSHAGIWDDLWLTKNQQAAKAYQQNNNEKAAELFENQQWKAASHYKSGNYDKAEELYANNQSATDLYNRGNALAHQKKFDEAIEAYQSALEQQPDFEDAKFNKELLEKLKQQQEQQQKNDNQNEQDNQQQQDQQNNEQQQKNDQQSEQEQQQQQSQESEQEGEQQKKQQEVDLEDKRDEQEKDQALEQWLRKIPDDPGGLLRRKMYREYKKRGRENRFVKKVW